MELKEGYKETEVGVIPEDWSLINFGDAFEYLSTATYSRADTVSDGDVKYIHYGDIHTRWNHFLDFSKEEVDYVSEDQAKGYALLKDGDIIVADASEDYNGIGKLVEVQNLNDCRAISGLHTFLLRPRKSIFSSGFAAYLHSNKQIKAQFDRLATGLKVYGVTKTNIKKVNIPLPPTIEEQEKIAKVLSDTNKLIQALEQKIVKKKLIKQGAMQELLTGKRRLPNLEFSEGYKDTEIGVIPKDWRLAKLSSLINSSRYIRYGVVQPGNYNTNGCLMLRSQDYSKGWQRIATMHRVSLELEEQYGNAKIQHGDLVVTLVGAGVGQVVMVPSYLNGTILSRSTGRIAVDSEKASNELVFQFLSSKSGASQFIGGLKEGAQPVISASDVGNVLIPLPPTIEEQKAIAQVLTEMDKELEVLEKSLNKYKILKQGLMQQLLTGTTRLV